MPTPYRGRFAPSPTGPLHAGSLVAALASWLDARAHGGAWLVRIEDVDLGRCMAGADAEILRQLAACGLLSDEAPVWQSQRGEDYQRALDRLVSRGLAYPCGCTRKQIEAAQHAQGLAHQRHSEWVYPGTCRQGLQGRPARAWRLNVGACLSAGAGPQPVCWTDRRLGPQCQDVTASVGDFVLRRADGLWAYQLAVVVDDGAQRISHVVRGEDLCDNTARQLVLQRALGLPTPAYLHTPVVRDARGEKLSKQHGAPAVDVSDPVVALQAAAQTLGLPAAHGRLPEALAQWVAAWRERYGGCLQSQAVNTPPAPESSPALQDGATALAPAHVAHPKTIKSFVKRAGRTTTGQSKAFADWGPRFLLPYAAQPLDAVAAFGRTAPLVLEIGFGMGEATAHIAGVRPLDNFLCCEVHEPGVGALLKRIGEQGLKNIRIIQHDAVEVLDHMLPEASLDGVHIFFPDPWHKKKHNKRRLIQAPFVHKLVQRLKPGGYLHCATDWQPYAEQMLAVLGTEPQLVNTATDAGLGGYAPKPDYRPLTKFENRGLRLGHGVWDLVFTRRPG